MTSDDPQGPRPPTGTPSAAPTGTPSGTSTGTPSGTSSDASSAVPTGTQSAAPRDPVPDPDPDEQTLAAVATPASVRRAPRIGAFVRTGALLGAVAGWLAAILGTGTTGEARTGAILISTAAVALLGALVAAGVAALADRRSARRPRRTPAR